MTEDYPRETARFLREERDQFANPVGHAFYRGIEGLYEELLRGWDPEKVNLFLDKIMRVKAAQGFTPSQALAWLFGLKKVVREELAAGIRGGQISSELLAFESKIDDLALLSFDIYMACREKIWQIRLNEVKDRTYRLLQRAELMVGPEEVELRDSCVDDPA